MNDNPILDDLKEEPIKKNGIRPLAMILEFGPYVLTYFGFFTLIFFALLPVWYLLISWYIFQASKFKTLDIIIAETVALVPVIGLFGILFKLESWDGAKEILVFAISLGFIFSGLLLFRFFHKKDDPLEYRFSLKLFSRIIFYTANLIYAIYYLF